jgi:uncharacterized protein
MSGPILKELHRLRRHIKDLEAKIEQAPRQLQIQQAKLAKQQDVLRQAQDSLKQLQKETRDKEGSIKATLQQIAKYEKQLNEAASKKEYDTLKSEIAQEKALISKLEDEILTDMTLAEEKTVKLAEIEQATQKAEADFAKYQKEQEERLERFAGEKTRAQEELTTTEATLPADVKAKYDRLVAVKGQDALAGVASRTCGACYTEITSQMLGELKRGVFMMCKNCGRMLYAEG